MSQAPGFWGMSDSGHCSSAATRASWASSSAMPTSRTMRVSPAITRADSILHTASMARCVSVAVTATDHTMFRPSAQVGLTEDGTNRRIPTASLLEFPRFATEPGHRPV